MDASPQSRLRTGESTYPQGVDYIGCSTQKFFA